MTTSDGGAVYHRWINNQGVGGSAPSRNASRRPGEWQSLYIWFRAPRFDANGKKIENAKFIRVLHNGLSIQNDVEVDGPTRAAMETPEAPTNPIMLQGDHGPVAYRNIYIRPLREIIKRWYGIACSPLLLVPVSLLTLSQARCRNARPVRLCATL
ncbi:MAG: DUF1080 domain-containing protein [Pyrinomonadaceae bacterium]